MFYQKFDNNITVKWNVFLKNWPLLILCSPSDIGSCNKVQLLYQVWESGTTYFQRLMEDEFNEWEKIGSMMLWTRWLHRLTLMMWITMTKMVTVATITWRQVLGQVQLLKQHPWCYMSFLSGPWGPYTVIFSSTCDYSHRTPIVDYNFHTEHACRTHFKDKLPKSPTCSIWVFHKQCYGHRWH